MNTTSTRATDAAYSVFMTLRLKPILFWVGAIVLVSQLKPFWAAISGIIVWQIVFSLLFSLLLPRGSQTKPQVRGMSQSDGRLTARFVLNYYLSQVLCMGNPITLVQALRQLFGQFVEAIAFWRPIPTIAVYVQKTAFRLPFDGEWLVLKGGVTPQESHSWDISSQRFAYDLVVVDSEGRSFANAGANLGDYYAYGKPVLAPADGTVVEAVSGVSERLRSGDGWLDWLTRDARGNFVIIEHAHDEFCMVAHLMPGSVKVKKGDKVLRGQPLGLCGNSGYSTEPHLHLQFQNGRSFYLSSGLPVKFNGFSCRRPTDQEVAEGHLVAGTIVSSLDAPNISAP